MKIPLAFSSDRPLKKKLIELNHDCDSNSFSEVYVAFVCNLKTKTDINVISLE